MLWYTKLGGRKFLGWEQITIISTVALFTGKLNSGEFITITLAAFTILTGVNAATKIIQKKNREDLEED